MRSRWIWVLMMGSAFSLGLAFVVLGMWPDPPRVPDLDTWPEPIEPPTILLGSGPVPSKDVDAAEEVEPQPTPKQPLQAASEEVPKGTDDAPEEPPEVVPLQRVAAHPALTPMPMPAPGQAAVQANPAALGSDSVVVRIHTVPEGTEVQLDGRSRGKSPVKLRVNPGAHTLLLDAGSVRGQFALDATEDMRLCYSTTRGELEPVDCAGVLSD